MDLERYDRLFPMAYLVLGAIIAIVCHMLKIPEGISGLLVGAALTRVKMPVRRSSESKE
jgi:hypothetical protein